MVTIEVLRDDLRKTRVVDAAPGGVLGEGEVKLVVDSFGLSANNVTYAAFGESMAYWRFFPASDDRWGCVPVWGFGDVVDSNAPGIDVGERFYGYFPMAREARMRVEAGKGGMVAVDDHRRQLPAIYNQYLPTSPDAPHQDETLLLRPLFATSFLIEAFLAGQGYFGAEAVVLSSASSKTAYGLAFILARAAGSPEVIGLTSARNRAFVEQLGLYNRVLTYDEIELDPDALVYVDMAGDAAVREAVHRLAGDRLRHSAVVGRRTGTGPRSASNPCPGRHPSSSSRRRSSSVSRRSLVRGSCSARWATRGTSSWDGPPGGWTSSAVRAQTRSSVYGAHSPKEPLTPGAGTCSRWVSAGWWLGRDGTNGSAWTQLRAGHRAVTVHSASRARTARRYLTAETHVLCTRWPLERPQFGPLGTPARAARDARGFTRDLSEVEELTGVTHQASRASPANKTRCGCATRWSGQNQVSVSSRRVGRR